MAATETKLEQTVREEQEEHDAKSKTAESLFDKTQYDDPELQLAKVDGQSIDKIKLSFTGSVMLDRGSKADVELYRKLSLGKGEVTLQVEGRCSRSGAGQATDRKGDLDVIVGEKTVKIETVYVSTADGVLHAIQGEEAEDERDGGQGFETDNDPED